MDEKNRRLRPLSIIDDFRIYFMSGTDINALIGEVNRSINHRYFSKNDGTLIILCSSARDILIHLASPDVKARWTTGLSHSAKGVGVCLS